MVIFTKSVGFELTKDFKRYFHFSCWYLFVRTKERQWLSISSLLSKTSISSWWLVTTLTLKFWTILAYFGQFWHIVFSPILDNYILFQHNARAKQLFLFCYERPVSSKMAGILLRAPGILLCCRLCTGLQELLGHQASWDLLPLRWKSIKWKRFLKLTRKAQKMRLSWISYICPQSLGSDPNDSGQIVVDLCNHYPIQETSNTNNKIAFGVS